MRMRLYVTFLIIILLSTGCIAESGDDGDGTKAEKKDIYKRSEFVLGTIVTVKIFEDGSEEVLNQIFSRLSEIEDRMSFNSKVSQVIDINKSAGINAVKVSDDTFNVISTAIDFANKSDGKFDPTIGQLVKLWGIGSEEAAIPSDVDRDNAVQLTDWNNVELDESEKNVYLKKKGMEIDLGAIAKGYASDEVIRILKDYQVKSGIINLGGNVYAYGEKRDGSAWRIGIQNPFSTRGEYLGIVNLKNKSVVTSGIYERYFEVEGVRYHHILDTKTGYPVENELASVTVIAESSINADAISTILFVAGVQEGLAFLKEYYPGVDAIFVTRDKEVYTTDLNEYSFKWTDDTFQIKE